jgi:hypothetical protein
VTRLDARYRQLLLEVLADHRNSSSSAARHMERAGYGSRARCQALIHQALREEAEAVAQTKERRP